MIFSIDQTERRATFFVVFLTALVAVFNIAYLVEDHFKVKNFYAKVSKGACPGGYTKVLHPPTASHACYLAVTPSYLWLQFAIMAAAALALFAFAWFRKRVGVVFVALLAGLAASSLPFVGIVFLAFGFWILWRAWRLQRYGVATFTGASRLAREQAQARKSGTATPTATSTPRPIPAKKVQASDGPRVPAEPSKRYTPPKPTKPTKPTKKS